MKRAPQNDVTSILAALAQNNPDDAAAANLLSSMKRAPQDDVTSILAALAQNNPDDAAAAKPLSSMKRWAA
ncbi:hypothetical protein GMOD_00000190 [Pyrenophora seminiperda CCB06]|uniref:Uncharacterized protein n=1 Tax=Pyrenophora seminiperda CCB06 TaxID=1302712 RepID=A0A3M7M6L7_9PLEO|nr:hypothetical protein GMOD_00000190 [Pyrenophora seminiperda CCB06]